MSTQTIDRLAALLGVLTDDWQQIDWLLSALSEHYPARAETGGYMLRRDLRWLGLLGFIVECSPEKRYRLVGHARFGAETPIRRCKRCGQWRGLDAFTKDVRRGSGKMIYCRFCNKSAGADHYLSKHPDKARRNAKPRNKKTVIDGVEYESRKAAGAALGVSQATIRRWASQKNGMPRKARGTAVTINGVEYESLTAAAKAIGVSVSAISRRKRRTGTLP